MFGAQLLGAGGRTRTDTSFKGPRILSPVRLPFRHTGKSGRIIAFTTANCQLFRQLVKLPEFRFQASREGPSVFVRTPNPYNCGLCVGDLSAKFSNTRVQA